MQKNVGGFDRLLRFVIGTAMAIISLAGIFSGLLKWGVLIAGIILIITSIIRLCPLNAIFGINTCKVK